MKAIGIKKSVNNYIKQWFIRRSGYQSDEIILNGRIIYILPSKYGFFFSLVIISMLAGSTNYENSMGFLLTFLLSGLMISGMLYTYRNLHSLKITPSHSKPVFCGENAVFELNAIFTNKHEGYAIHYGNNKIKNYNTTDIGWEQAKMLNISVSTARRGYLYLQPVRIWTQFPIGFFQAWSWLHPSLRTIVYPKPEGKPLKLSYDEGEYGRSNITNDGNDDYAGMRKYISGDSLKHIAWKAVAKGHDLYTKQYLGYNSGEIILDWFALDKSLNTEEKLSQLCLWVLEAHKNSLRYGLRLPSKIIKNDNGEEHKKECLTALALFENERF